MKNLLRSHLRLDQAKKKKMINWKQFSQKIKKREWEIVWDIVTSQNLDEEREPEVI